MTVVPLLRPAALNWGFVASLALDPENLPRVLAGMGFDRRVTTLRRGDIRWWQPPYAAIGAVPLAARAHRREHCAAINRAMAERPVLMMHRYEPETTIFIDTVEGCWRSLDHAQRGPDLVALGALMWEVRPGRAAHRIARLCGLPEAPYADAG